jgi:hypothetical protein
VGQGAEVAGRVRLQAAGAGVLRGGAGGAARPLQDPGAREPGGGLVGTSAHRVPHHGYGPLWVAAVKQHVRQRLRDLGIGRIVPRRPPQVAQAFVPIDMAVDQQAVARPHAGVARIDLQDARVHADRRLPLVPLLVDRAEVGERVHVAGLPADQALQPPARRGQVAEDTLAARHQALGVGVRGLDFQDPSPQPAGAVGVTAVEKDEAGVVVRVGRIGIEGNRALERRLRGRVLAQGGVAEDQVVMSLLQAGIQHQRVAQAADRTPEVESPRRHDGQPHVDLGPVGAAESRLPVAPQGLAHVVARECAVPQIEQNLGAPVADSCELAQLPLRVGHVPLVEKVDRPLETGLGVRAVPHHARSVASVSDRIRGPE